MKKVSLLFLAFSLSLLCLVAQDEKEVKVKTEVSDVTVFINGAQIQRNKSVNIPAGKSKIKFVDLSPYVDAKSVQVKMAGNVMVLGVNYQTNTEQAILQLSEEKQNEIDTQYGAVIKQIENGKVALGLVKDEIDFLNQNKKIGGANTGVSLVTLRETANYYRERMSVLKNRELELNNTLRDLEVKRKLILKQEDVTPTDKPKVKGEIVVEVDAKVAATIKTELSYYVKNAGWFPSYDIRAVNVEQPMELLYKANVFQHTEEDWKNVHLKVSSANPALANIAPVLKMYRLDYYLAPPRYDVADVGNNEIKGVVLSADNQEPLIGASVSVPGSTIGTMTDINGQFTLTKPYGATNLKFTYIGYKEKTVPISSNFMTVRLNESRMMLDEVVVTGFGSTKKKTLTGAVSTSEGRYAGVKNKGESTFKTAPRLDIAMPTTMVENQTATEFEIKIPYSIKSGGKATVIEVDRYTLSAEYEYYAIPKVNLNAFLRANITDWEQYNLLEGEANIFFEGTYIGKTIIDARQASDTLNISLGRDKNITVKREKQKENSKKNFFGNKREESRHWKIELKNNKSQAINFTLIDQVPVSENNEIEVIVENTSSAQMNAETGELKWSLKLKSTSKKELDLKYKVKYPKDKNLIIE